MNEYLVTRKSDGAEVYRYQAETPIAWSGMEFETHDHTLQLPVVVDAPVVGQRMDRVDFLRRFTQDERVAIRTAAKTNAMLEDFMALLDMANSVSTTDPDTVAGVHLLESAGLIGVGRAQEILNGN